VIDRANVAAIFGHSSHHAKGFEIYRQRLILYDCGDFLIDYEGLKGYEQYRGDLALMYFADFDQANGGLTKLTITPLQIKRLRLVRPLQSDVEWVLKLSTVSAARAGFARSSTPTAAFR